MVPPIPWWREYQGFKIELMTERVDNAWVCPQIRVIGGTSAAPTLLTLAGVFPSIFQALNAGVAHARQWIDAATREGRDP